MSSTNMNGDMKAVILIGGPHIGTGKRLNKSLGAPFIGTRFRPLSFEVPKPLFPVAGCPMIEHHIEACLKVCVILSLGKNCAQYISWERPCFH